MRKLLITLGSLTVLCAIAAIVLAIQLSDDNLHKQLTQLLNNNFSGKFTVERVHYSAPTTVEVQSLQAMTPDGEPVLSLQELRAHVLFWPLFTGHVTADVLEVRQVALDVRMPKEGEALPLAQALTPEFELPPLQSINVPVQVDLSTLRLGEVSVRLHGNAPAQLRLSDLRLTDTHLALYKDRLDAAFTVTAGAWMRAKDKAMALSDARIRLESARVQFASLEAWASVKADLGDLTLAAKAYVQGNDTGLKRAELRRLRVDADGGWVEGEATAAVQLTPELRIGPHHLRLKAHALPVRRWVAPLVGAEALLPKKVSLALKAEGRALWPPTGTVDVDTVAEGLIGEDWPGLPRSAEIRGRFLTHPDLLEVLRLEVNIDKLPNFAIQGSLPLQTESAMQLLKAIHSPAPLAGLYRVPVAPADKRPD